MRVYIGFRVEGSGFRVKQSQHLNYTAPKTENPIPPKLQDLKQLEGSEKRVDLLNNNNSQ